MVYTENCQLLEVGIDYITATGKRIGTGSSLRDFGSYIVEELVDGGAKKTTYKAQGYHGTKAEGAAVGTRYDGTLVRLSGPTANEYWEQVYSMSEAITRLDLQVTVIPDCPPPKMLKRLWSSLRRREKRLGRQPEFKMIVGRHGPQTLMLGSRSSERYGRVYDKGLESGLARFIGALRAELELKKEQAQRMAFILSESTNQQASIAATVSGFMQSHCSAAASLFQNWIQPGPLSDSCRLAATAIVCTDDADIYKERTGVNRSLRFLQRSVAPTVARLVAAGYSSEVHQALGLSCGLDLDYLGPTGPTH